MSDGAYKEKVAQMTLHDRLNPDPRHIPSNVVPFERVERREPQRWWERAKAGALYGSDENGMGYIKDMSGRGPDAA